MNMKLWFDWFDICLFRVLYKYSIFWHPHQIFLSNTHDSFLIATNSTGHLCNGICECDLWWSLLTWSQDGVSAAFPLQGLPAGPTLSFCDSVDVLDLSCSGMKSNEYLLKKLWSNQKTSQECSIRAQICPDLPTQLVQVRVTRTVMKRRNAKMTKKDGRANSFL